MSNLEFERERPAAPRVVVVGLASCFGCQLQITNAEPYLLDVLGQIDLRYWQLASSDPMPEEFDVAVIEGAATTAEAIETLKAVRKKASAVIAVGACATTAGIPGMAAGNVEAGVAAVYGEAGAPEACGELVDPAPISAYIDVDFEVLCCPIDTFAFIDIRTYKTEPMTEAEARMGSKKDGAIDEVDINGITWVRHTASNGTVNLFTKAPSGMTVGVVIGSKVGWNDALPMIENIVLK